MLISEVRALREGGQDKRLRNDVGGPRLQQVTVGQGALIPLNNSSLTRQSLGTDQRPT